MLRMSTSVPPIAAANYFSPKRDPMSLTIHQNVIRRSATFSASQHERRLNHIAGKHIAGSPRVL
jgi:hypothetical protein